jgi:hypothetical protein
MIPKQLMAQQFAALALPVANYGDEIEVPLLASREQSEAGTFNFPEPVIIVGAHASVIRNADEEEGLLIPGLDDIAVQLQSNKRNFWTAQQKGSALDGDAGAQWNTLSALSVRERYLCISLPDANPIVSAKFKWKRFTQGTPYYVDALVSLCFFVIYPNALPRGDQ